MARVSVDADALEELIDYANGERLTVVHDRCVYRSEFEESERYFKAVVEALSITRLTESEIDG